MANEYLDASLRGRAAEEEWRELEAAFGMVRQVLLEHLEAAPIGKSQLILNLHGSLHSLDGVKRALLKTITDGKNADLYLAARDAVAVEGLTRP